MTSPVKSFFFFPLYITVTVFPSLTIELSNGGFGERLFFFSTFHLFSSEKLGMTSFTVQNKFIIFYAVNQNPVRFDMAVTLTLCICL